MDLSFLKMSCYAPLVYIARGDEESRAQEPPGTPLQAKVITANRLCSLDWAHCF